MVRIDRAGVSRTSYAEYVAELQRIYRAALGADLDLAGESPQGQQIGLEALAYVEIDEAIVTVSNAGSREHAVGAQLDDLGTLLRVFRGGPAFTTVEVTLGGVGGTVVEAGKRARSTMGDLFQLVNDATIGATGTVDADMRGVTTGPVPAMANTITSIVDVVSGWETVTNAASGVVGRNAELDDPYRVRQGQLTDQNAHATIAAIENRIREVDGVAKVFATSNDEATDDTVRQVTIPANSILAVVQGGENAAIGKAIAESKASGIPTSGTTSVDHTQDNGDVVTINFSRPTAVPIQVTLATTALVGFPSGAANDMLNALVAYIGEFEIGQYVDINRLLTPVQAFPGHQVTMLAAALVSGSADITTSAGVALNELLTLAPANVTISVS